MIDTTGYVTNQTVPPPPPPPPSFPPPQRSSRLLVILLIVIVAVAALGGVTFAAYSFIAKTPVVPQYTEANLLSSILDKSGTINAATYAFSTGLTVVARESDAKPFTIDVSNSSSTLKQYQNDSKRAQDINTIMSTLRSSYGERTKYSYVNNKSIATKIFTPYPTSIKSFRVPQKDPLGVAYTYTVSSDKKNFSLTTSFETPAAVTTIKSSYGNTATSTIVVGQKITFTKDSGSYLYLSTQPPQPFFVYLGDMLKQLPADVSGTISASASANWGAGASSDWKFNIDATGNFGDLSYKVDADALRKNDIYYFRINNIPSFFGMYSSIKGQWVKVDPSKVATSSNDGTAQFSQYEKSYKENRDRFVNYLKLFATVADAQHVISFSNTPASEVVDGRTLTRYEIKIRKDSILPFYKALVVEVNKDPALARDLALNDEATLTYLQSPEFSQVFDYYQANTHLTLWIDDAGYPAIIQYKLRAVPPDTAFQLKDKQIEILSKLTFSGINKPISIDTPANAKLLSEIMAAMNANSYARGDLAALKLNLSSVRSKAEILYDKSKNSYGTKAFHIGACSAAPGTLFADAQIYKYISDAAGGDAKKATCSSTLVGTKVTSWAASVPLPATGTPGNYSWCVDSTGNATQITGNITGSVCK